MPFINLKMVGKLTKEQKEKIAKEFSDTFLKVAGKPKEYTYLVIEEVSGENWAQGEKFFGFYGEESCLQIYNFAV